VRESSPKGEWIFKQIRCSMSVRDGHLRISPSSGRRISTSAEESH
jgi:hypothetical protein